MGCVPTSLHHPLSYHLLRHVAQHAWHAWHSIFGTRGHGTSCMSHLFWYDATDGLTNARQSIHRFRVRGISIADVGSLKLIGMICICVVSTPLRWRGSGLQNFARENSRISSVQSYRPLCHWPGCGMIGRPVLRSGGHHHFGGHHRRNLGGRDRGRDGRFRRCGEPGGYLLSKESSRGRSAIRGVQDRRTNYQYVAYFFSFLPATKG